MPNRRFNTQVAQPRTALAMGGSAKPAGRAAQQRRSKPKVDEKKGRHFRQYKSYDAPPSKITRAGKKDGGSLKAVDKEKNPGLAKLPTKVRNKMGFMKDGGKVKAKGSQHPTAGRQGNLLHKLKSQKQIKAITDTKKYKDASYNEKQKMLDAGGAYTKSAKKDGGRIRKMGGGMSTARRDMMSGYYKNDMGI